MISFQLLKPLSLRRLVATGKPPPVLSDFTPMQILVVDVERPLADVRPRSIDSRRQPDAAWILVRLHARPLGVIQLTAGDLPCSASRLSTIIHERWGSAIAQHLQTHDRPASSTTEVGIRNTWPACSLTPPKSMPLLSVVIPTFRRPEDIVRCVNSILANDYSEFEILVVDNAPETSETAIAVAKEYGNDPRVRYLAEWAPGASRARNKGVQNARGDIIAFVDDDIVVDRYWAGALVNALHERPDVDCVAGLVIPQSLDKPVEFWFEQFGGFNRGYTRRSFDLNTERGDTVLYPYTAGSLGGLGNAAFRRSVLRQPEPFDVTLGPGTPAYGAEDQDAFVALLREGRRILYEPAALVYHRHRATYDELRWQVFAYGAATTAALLHWSLRDRAVGVELASRIAKAIPSIMRGGSRIVVLETASQCPPTLRRLERLGYLYGPVAYFRAVRFRRDVEHASTAKVGQPKAGTVPR